MKIEFEIKAFGKVEVQGAEDAFNSSEIVRVKRCSKDTTLADLELMLAELFDEVERGYANPEKCIGRITIRAKKENGEIVFLG